MAALLPWAGGLLVFACWAPMLAACGWTLVQPKSAEDEDA